MTWMAFIMPAYIKAINWQQCLLVCCALLFSQSSYAEGFTIRSVDTRLDDKVYLLNAAIDFDFSSDALEALQNGVPIIIKVKIKVEKQRNWWFDNTIAELEQEYLLLYHSLSQKYIVNNINSREQKDYNSLSTALNSLGTIESLPILDAQLVKAGNQYIVYIKTYLDLERLPAPMRPIAYISTEWQLESDWYQWPLQQ